MTKNYVVRDIRRADPTVIDSLAGVGVATAHEAAGRIGLLGVEILPRQEGITIAGSAVTVSSAAGDNLMIHAAVEMCQPGDVLVVTTTEPSVHGMFGDLLATSLAARGVRGLIMDAGVRDIHTLRSMGFPVWSRAVHAEGTVKATGGSVNVPVICAGARINPGDVIIADDDGVLCLPRERAADVLTAATARAEKEEEKRVLLASGILGIDMYDLRPLLAELGVEYVDSLPESGTRADTATDTEIDTDTDPDTGA